MKQNILQILIDHQGCFVSGEEISKTLSVSRTAIWKHINSLKGEGYDIKALPRNGYCLKIRPDILSLEEINIGLQTSVLGKTLHVFDEVSSTNDLLKKMAAEGAAEGTVVLAEHQIKGRGRMGRPWLAPKGGGLWFSLVLRPALKPFQASQLIFVSAVGVCRALRKYTGLPVAVKWPNDLLLDGKKVCGILTELSAEIDLINYIVIGIGINVNQQVWELPPELQHIAGSLAMSAGHSFNRAGLLRSLLFELEQEYHDYLARGFDAVLQRWRQLDSTLGHEVIITSGGESFTGVARDIDEMGRLLVKTPEGDLRQVMAGDVSLRKK